MRVMVRCPPAFGCIVCFNMIGQCVLYVTVPFLCYDAGDNLGDICPHSVLREGDHWGDPAR